MKDSRLFNSVKEQMDKFDAYALLSCGLPSDTVQLYKVRRTVMSGYLCKTCMQGKILIAVLKMHFSGL